MRTHRTGISPARTGSLISMALALGIALLALPACGNRNLVVNVDILSFMDPSDTEVAFGPVPALPGGLETGEQTVVPEADINLVSNLDDVSNIRTVSLRVELVTESYSGSGADTLRLYLSDPSTDPRTTPAVMMVPVVLTPGAIETTVSELSADARVVGLFSNEQMKLAITNSLRGPDNGEALSGRVKITAINATVIAGRKGL